MSMKPRAPQFRPLVVIPALNAVKTLPTILLRLASLDTLVVDDGSEDDTFLIAQALATFALRHDRNQGHSAAIISGENYALANGYSHIVLLDSDGQHPPEYAQETINMLQTNDLIIGDRFALLEDIPFQKIASNLFASLLIERATGHFFRDVSCGFRGYCLGRDLLTLTTIGYSRVYSQIVAAIIAEKRIARVPIPAVYPRSSQLATRASEIEGLCHAVLAIFPANKAALSVMSSLRKKQSFSIALKGVEFAIKKLDCGETYHFSVNQQIARRLYAN